MQTKRQKKGFNFREQKETAVRFERIAIDLLNTQSAFENFVHATDDAAIADAHDPLTDEWLEIKTDHTETSNHFVERYSNYQRKTPGGPWQYLERGAKYYSFYYIKLRLIYVFHTDKLVKTMEQLLRERVISDSEHRSLVEQDPPTYQTCGYKVQKKLLDKICLLKIQVPGT